MSSKVRSLARARKLHNEKAGEIVVPLLGLINSNSSLAVLIGCAMPIRQSFLLAKLVKSVAAEIEQYQSANKVLCEKYANKDGEGKAVILDTEGKRVVEGQPGRYDIPEEKMVDFNREHHELIETEVSIPGVRIKVSDLNGVSIAPAHMVNLDWLIQE